jgi:hypothetical protein
MSVEDNPRALPKVRTYGEREQEYWLRDITAMERFLIGDPKNVVDLVDLRLDDITGEVTHTHVRQGFMFSFDNYEIIVVRIDRKGIEVEVISIDR